MFEATTFLAKIGPTLRFVGPLFPRILLLSISSSFGEFFIGFCDVVVVPGFRQPALKERVGKE